jgi:outer membrane immunogenic protein
VSLPPFSDTETMTGWSAGIGTEIKLTSGWSVGFQYRYVDLGMTNF